MVTACPKTGGLTFVGSTWENIPEYLPVPKNYFDCKFTDHQSSVKETAGSQNSPKNVLTLPHPPLQKTENLLVTAEENAK